MHEHSASGSGSDSSLTPKGDARGGIEWEVECILAARPEFARLNEQTVLAELRLCGESVRAECVRQFVADVSNMPESPRSPIGLLRGYIRRANQPGVGAGVRSGQGESAFAIKSRIEAAQGELDRLPKYADDRTDEQKARAVELRGRIAGWRKELAGG